MDTNTAPCSGKAKFLLEIHSPVQVSKFVMSLMPDTKGNAGADYFRSASQQTLETLLNALHLLDKPYTLNDINSTLLSQEKILKLKKDLNEKHPTSPEVEAYNNLINRYTTAHGFDIEKFKLTLGGMIGRIHSFIQTTA